MNRSGSIRVALPCLIAVTLAFTGFAVAQEGESSRTSAEPTGRPAGTVGYMGHRAWRHPGGGEERFPLQTDSRVYVDDLVAARGGPVEIDLLDGSVLRIAAGTRMEIEESAVSEEREQGRRISVRLLVGRAWASVTRALGGDDSFEVKTRTAAAGVRGTSFRVDAREDSSTLVRVYQGAVAVAGRPQAGSLPAEPEPERRQVGKPAQISRGEWERRVEAMMSVEVSADGRVGEPSAFDAEEDQEDPWVRWNTERDAER